MNQHRSRQLSLVAAFVIATAASAGAGPVTFDFTGSQGGPAGFGGYGNTRTFTDGGVTVTASAWAYTWGSLDNALQKAALGRWSSGLGSCNRAEDPETCSDLQEHQVDNAGPDDWVMFLFSAPIDISSVTIDSYGSSDHGVSYWTGNVSGPVDLGEWKYSDLASFGFAPRTDSTARAGSGPRGVSIGGGFVNALIFGAQSNANANGNAYFKITGLGGLTPPPQPLAVPEPGTLAFMLLGAAATLVRKRV